MVLALHEAYTKPGALTVYPTDVPETAKRLTKVCPDRILVWPNGGPDTIEPFLDAGKQVSVIGCVGFAHPLGCLEARAQIERWSFASRLHHVLNCEEWARLKESAA